MEFLLGFAGAFAFFLLFGAGVFCGWKVREHTGKVTAEQLTPAQKQQLRDERDAWQALHNYGVEDAYNLHPEDREGGRPA